LKKRDLIPGKTVTELVLLAVEFNLYTSFEVFNRHYAFKKIEQCSVQYEIQSWLIIVCYLHF